MILNKETVQAAIKRAMELGARDFDEACASAAQALAIPVEHVRDAAFLGDAAEGSP